MSMQRRMHWYNTMNFGRQTVWWKKTHGHLMTDYALKMAEAIEKDTSIDDVHKAWEHGAQHVSDLRAGARTRMMSSSARRSIFRPSMPITIPGIPISASMASRSMANMDGS